MSANVLPLPGTGLLAGLRELLRARSLLVDLARRDFQSRYLGSVLGLTWAFIQPTVTILIMWFVFQVGFRNGPVLSFPFILWMTTGMITWNFFAEAWGAATGCILESGFLVRKVRFQVALLPVVKLLSALVIHTFFIALCIAMFAGYGFPPRVNLLQIGYYLAACSLFALGLSWFTSSLVLFYRDLGQIVGMLLQFGMWLTPVFWQADSLPARWRPLVEYNPMHYIVRGYRDAFMSDAWFWNYPGDTLYFWTVTTVIFVTGALVFRRLKPHFADVL